MATIILGGLSGSNWPPLLIPVIAVFLFFVGIDMLIRFIRRKLHQQNHLASPNGDGPMPGEELNNME